MTPKELVRSLVLFNRRLLSDEFISEKSQQIANRLKVLLSTERSIRQIHTFLPIKKNGEIDTWHIIRQLSNEYQFIASKTDFQHHRMHHYAINEKTKFVSDKMGIPTPIGEQEIAPSNIDMVLIPLLASDKDGNRIGYGKGYYDQLIDSLSPQTIKVGLNMTGLFDHFPFMEPHDQKMDYCITPFQTIDCRHV